MVDDNFQDAEFEESTNDDNESKKYIRGGALYYSTSQVATILGIADSKVRYYTNQFEDILHIEISNKHRRYTDKDIEKLKFMVELKNQGLTIKQIQEYCQEVDIEHGIEKINEKNPLSIQTLAKALMEEQQNQLNQFKSDILEAVTTKLQEHIDLVKEHNEVIQNNVIEQVSLTVDTIIDEKLNSYIDIQEKKETEREAKMIENMRELMNNRKVSNIIEANEVQEKKGIFKRLFGI